MNRYLTLPLFLLLTVGGGIAIGISTAPGAWYAGLTKPPFNPPNWLFAPVWTALYVLIGIAGWRVWKLGARDVPMRLWWLQLGLNFLWSPVFFGAQMIGPALVVILALFGTIIGFISSTWNVDRVASLLFVPYAAWVAFASLLNASIFLLN